MKKNNVLEAIGSIAPEDIALEWDNCGMQIDLKTDEIQRILIALDITGKVIEQAILEKVDMIITHHPLLFHPVKNISFQSVNGDYIIQLIENGISVYSAHTSFDYAESGNNDYLAKQLGLSSVNIENTDPNHSKMPIWIGSFASALTLKEVGEKLAQVLNNPGGIRVSGNPDAPITKVGLCTGGAGEYYKMAGAYECDLYITGEIRHHELVEAMEIGISIIDAGHFGTENIFVENFAAQLRGKLGNAVTVMESASNTTPYSITL